MASRIPNEAGSEMNERIARLRATHRDPPWRKDLADSDPFVQFGLWFEEALQADLIQPNAMALATATPTGRPSVRTVLLKSYDAQGFVFYTNYRSRKGLELAANPRAALLFWWDRLHRQVRIEGKVVQTETQESDQYFASRPIGSQLSAVASPQSAVVPDRATLQRRVRDLQATHGDKSQARPPDWGGYRLRPHTFEFWQGQADRLHDRLEYCRLNDGRWEIRRLAP